MSREIWEIMRKLRGDEIALQLAFQCAPLITGLKESNLLNIKKQDYQRMKDIFKESELTIYPLGIHAGKITVFLYHRERLEKFFSGESVLALLHEIGYIDTDLKQVLPVFRTHYQQYLKEKKVFPHEMGLLLGYPPEDVKGFIHNQGKNYLYSGYWKVYDRPHEKIRLFQKYEHSREKLIQLLSYGMRIEEIIAICSNTEIWQLVDCDCQYAS